MIILMQMELPTPTAILVIEEYKSRRICVVYAIERYVSANDGISNQNLDAVPVPKFALLIGQLKGGVKCVFTGG